MVAFSSWCLRMTWKNAAAASRCLTGSDNRNAEPVHAVVVFSIVLPLTRPKTPDTPKPFEQIWKSCNGVYI